MRLLAQSIAAGWLLSPAIVVACPWCNSTVAERVRGEIFGGNFAANLAVAVLPFPVLLAIIAIVYFWPGKAVSQNRSESGS